MDAEPQWVPLGEEELGRLGEVLKRVFRVVALALFLAIAVASIFFRESVGLGAATSYSPENALHRSYPDARVGNVSCSPAGEGWICSYRLDGRRCYASVSHGHRVVLADGCGRP